MMRNWHHGHSLGAGLLGGLVLAGGHVVLLCVAFFALGALTAIIAFNLRRLVQWTGGYLNERNHLRWQ